MNIPFDPVVSLDTQRGGVPADFETVEQPFDKVHVYLPYVSKFGSGIYIP